MTTNNDHFTARITDSADSAGWGLSKEWTVGVPIDGTVDPTGEYPKRETFFGNSINQAARGAKINQLKVGGSYYDMNLSLLPPSPSMFPFNQANETPSGHSIEIDDTPGNERILLKHRTGSGIEMKPDGSIVISSGERKIEVVRGDSKLIVNGTGDMVYEGDVNMKVLGDYNLDVSGNYNLNVGTTHHEKIAGSKRSHVGKVRSEITKGPRDTRTFGLRTDLSLNDHHEIVKGDKYLYADNLETTINNLIEVSAKYLQQSILERATLITERMVYSAESGRLGGKSVMHFGNVYTGPDREGQPGGNVTFYGSLVGRAQEAWTSKYALNAHQSYQAHISNYASVAEWADEARVTQSQTYAQDIKGTTPSAKYPDWTGDIIHDGSPTLNKEPEFVYGEGNDKGGDNSGINWNIRNKLSTVIMPGYIDSSEADSAPYWPDNPSTQTLLLQRSRNGYKNLRIDHNNSLEEQIGMINYGGYFNNHPTLPQIRSAIRGIDLYNPDSVQRKMLEECIKRGLMSYDFKKPMRAEVEYIVKRNSVLKRYGKRLLGNPIENREKSFRLQYANKITGLIQLLPDPRYKFDISSPRAVTGSTRLSPNVTLAKFMGSPGNPLSIDILTRRSQQEKILRNLLPHALIIEAIESNDEFSNYNLLISEGLKIPLWVEYSKYRNKNSTVNAGYFNRWKSEGRGAVYQLVDQSGRVAWDKTFDLAVWMRDNVIYDLIEIDYDTFALGESESIQICVKTPAVSQTLTCQPLYNLSTRYNGKQQSADSLIKLIDPYIDEVREGIPQTDTGGDGTMIIASKFRGSREGNRWTGYSEIEGNHGSVARVEFAFSEATTATVSMTVSSEAGYDFGKVFVNDILQVSISGEETYNRTFSNVLKLVVVYSKDGSVNNGSDKLDATVTW